MADSKPEQLGLRGTLGHFESALRLLGGANATGAIASGVAFHAFAQNVELQSSVKLAAVLFLFGIFAFVVAYMSWFITTMDIDHALYKPGDPVWPGYLFWAPSKTPEAYQSSAKKTFILAMFVGLVSFIFFLIGLANVLMMAIRLQLAQN